jgi:hypothetical protein
MREKRSGGSGQRKRSIRRRYRLRRRRSWLPGVSDLRRRLSALLFAFLALAAATSAARSQMSQIDIGVQPPLFTIKSYLGRCLNMASPVLKLEAVARPEPALAIADCDGSVQQRFGVAELDAAHHVQLRGAGACLEAASAIEGAAVTLEPCSASPLQVFDLDGDSIILDSNWDLVVQLKESLTPGGTPLVLGKRLTSDVEFWDLISLDNPPRSPTSGFVTVADGPGLVGALASAQPNTVIQIPPGTMIEFTDLPAPLNIPEGVTLRGDRRGVLLGPQVWLSHGHMATGPTDDPGLFIMQASRTRVTGLRIRGPGRDPKGKMPPMKGVDMVVATVAPGGVRTDFSELVDHNDISDWGTSAVDLKGPDFSHDANCPLAPPAQPEGIHVLRNYIHDNLQNGRLSVRLRQHVPEERTFRHHRRRRPKRLCGDWQSLPLWQRQRGRRRAWRGRHEP